MTYTIPPPASVKAARAASPSVRNRRKHYIDRVKSATDGRARLNGAIDYLRAALAGAPEEQINRVVTDLIVMADAAGGIK